MTHAPVIIQDYCHIIVIIFKHYSPCYIYFYMQIYHIRLTVLAPEGSGCNTLQHANIHNCWCSIKCRWIFTYCDKNVCRQQVTMYESHNKVLVTLTILPLQNAQITLEYVKGRLWIFWFHYAKMILIGGKKTYV